MTFADKPIAYVQLTSSASVTPDLIHRTVASWMRDRRRDITVSKFAEDHSRELGGTIVMAGSCPLVAIPIEEKIPVANLLGGTTQEHVFPKWREALARHQAHIIVMPLQRAMPGAESDPLATLRLRRAAAQLTFETACALASLDDAIGIFWLPSKLLHDSRDFAERRTERRKSSAELLVRLDWFAGDMPPGVGLGACTAGMSMFAGREVLHPPTTEDPSAIYGRVLDVCSRLIDQEPSAYGDEPVGGESANGLTVSLGKTRAGQDVLRVDLAPGATA